MPVAIRTSDLKRTIELLRLVVMHADPESAFDAERLANLYAEQLEPSTIVITDHK